MQLIRRLRRLWCYVVLVGGGAGVLGFFASFVHVRHDDGALAGSPSGYEIVFAGAYRSPMLPRLVVIAYTPSLLLALLGLGSALRDRVRAWACYPAIVFGAASVAWWTLYIVGSYETKLVDAAIGGHALLLAGFAGVVGGLALYLADCDPRLDERDRLPRRDGG